MQYGLDRTPRTPAVTPGRTLFNCIPEQFTRFTGPGAAHPRPGLIEECLTRFKLSVVENSARLWTVVDADNTAQSSLQRSRYAALRAWWVEAGSEQVATERTATREWVDQTRRGRPASSEVMSERNAKRRQQFQIVDAIWREASTAIAELVPCTAPWLGFCMNRQLLRHNVIREVGERRVIVEACAALYDVYGFWPEYGYALDGKEFDFHACEAEIPTWLRRLAYVHAAPALTVFTTVNLAMSTLGDPSVLLKKLKEILTLNEVTDRTHLRNLCEAALL